MKKIKLNQFYKKTSKVICLGIGLLILNCELDKNDFDIIGLNIKKSVGNDTEIQLEKSNSKFLLQIRNYRINDLVYGSNSRELTELLDNRPRIMISSSLIEITEQEFMGIANLIEEIQLKKLSREDTEMGLDGAIWEVKHGIKSGYSISYLFWEPEFNTRSRSLAELVDLKNRIFELAGNS